MSHDPIPLRDDPGAPLGLRDDLERLRAAKPGYDVDAGLSRFAAALQIVPTPSHAPPSAAPPAPPAPSLAPAAAAAASGAKGLWWGLGAVGVASIAGLWFATRHAESPHAPAPRDASAIIAPTPRPVETSNAAPTDSATPIEVVLDDDAEPSQHTPRSARPATSPTNDPPSASLLAEEVAHLAALRASSGDASRALAMADEGQRKFARGVFGQEREAIAIGALARLGRAGEARSRAQTFLARHPKSPLAEGVRRAAGLD